MNQKLPAASQRFVTHFGEMGSRWGMNRTTARVFALLYLSPKPMHAGELSEALALSRSLIGGAIKELIGWRLIALHHLQGDRRDHFATTGDIWKIARVLVEERRKREIQPTEDFLKDLLAKPPENDKEQHQWEKIKQMHELLSMLTRWYDDINKVETQQLVRLLKLGSKVVSLYNRTGDTARKIIGK